MSIWTSVHRYSDLNVPYRCNYCGEVTTGCVCTGPINERTDTPGPDTWVDVATARTWHSRIRVSMDSAANGIECLMSVDEALQLIGMLSAAVKHIKADS